MARSNRRWTGADMLKLKDLAQKYPAATIAEQLGRSPTALAVKAHELQLSSTWQNANVRWRSPTHRGLGVDHDRMYRTCNRRNRR